MGQRPGRTGPARPKELQSAAVEDGEVTALEASESMPGAKVAAVPTGVTHLHTPQVDADAAIATLFQQHGKAIYGHCWRLVRDPSLAEDLMQQVFFEALRDFHQFRGQSSWRTWLFGIASHRCIDALRDKRRSAPTPTTGDAAMDAPAGTGPFEQLDHSQQLSALEDCLASLSPDNRAAVLMRFRSDLTYNQMAKDLDSSPEALQMRVSRTLVLLLKCLERKGWSR